LSADRFDLPVGGDEILLAHWRGLFVAAERVVRDLLRRHEEKHRAYHNASHVLALVMLADELGLAEDPTIGFAIWFHDAIYKPMNQDNEERSAVLAADTLAKLGFDRSAQQRVARFVLATKSHQQLEDSPALRSFLDLDLSILGAPPATYAIYAAAIRTEYRWVPQPMYRSGRRKILRDLLGRTQLYLTPELAGRLEVQARRNLTNELAAL
jgi:predicted metal-dependent HD superfamily phosphohydrolase